MKTIDSIDALEAIYEDALPLALTKVVTRLTPHYQRWISASKFCVLTTVGPEGTDGSPRGDKGPVVQIADDKTLLLPDWRGNNRIDSLRNIVRDGRVSALFMVPHARNVVRINGTAVLSDDPEITARFDVNGKHPRTVIVITVGEAYYQCAKAILRSGLWSDGPREDLPSAGQFVQEFDPEFDGEAYESGYEDYAKGRLW